MATTNIPPISVLLPTYNCSGTIRETLESVCWADEILVVDSFSTDQTLVVCADYGARIIQHEYVNSSKQKNWALPQCTNQWVLQIDSDEVLEPGLSEEIGQALSNLPFEVIGFRIPFKHHVLGKWMRYGGLYPDLKLRLFRRDAGHWSDREVHAHLVVDGEIRSLKNAILHYGMPTLSKQFGNLNRYTRYEADELYKKNRRFNTYRLVIHPWTIFLYKLLWLQGFRDGWRGFFLAAYAAIYTFLTWAKRWEMDELGIEESPR